ncbi:MULTISPECIES: AbrB/MazE/SpoVT family DNA-binding domain-containing protein [Agrobacterium]|uniref:AbrB family transcriptional regulator n=1 Tax=Agrobacterium tumefaciens TaxID=358 RepID=A0AAE6BJ79_AGRTU|nr:MULTISPECIES: AbrB/MazE/SpoVT family DNA-binding domain-containing protein [Agrobacterium]QCL76709.1 AbrB family transcriptional regulator [Agrobacterium tumefaciens]QCL82229.1 AbrB family transcriptional regulator [Agrobacterium tumefaciens]CUX64929.1 conserved hypothetical protein [Agrobacterium sp. NCPPB 925]
MTMTVAAKVQATVPAAVRELCRIVSGRLAGFVPGPDGRFMLVRADNKQPPTRFGRLRGHAGEGLDTDTVMVMSRGENEQ